GGGSGIPRPGAASRAHRGVLFLDEAPEFNSRVLESLRQPLEHGELVIHRAGGTARFPARFQLVLAANPCPCGMGAGKGLNCSCSPLERRRYLGRISGPLLDRIDLQVTVDAVTRTDIADGLGEPSAAVATRVVAARAAARARLGSTPWTINAEVPGSWLREHLRGRRQVMRDVDLALDAGLLSLRGADRVLRLAFTLADLAGRDEPSAADIGQALLLRTGRQP
ncbi:MAG: ATP-binding protein, partial [Promicromonosporaceae bacterium]|nr:ATP-binding protein [Promicromonosporaceae bacterium]